MVSLLAQYIITDDDIINFVVSYDPPGNCIPPTRSLFDILEENWCEEIKSLWGAQMPEMSYETEAIKLNNDKIVIRNCAVSCKDLKFSAQYKAIVKRQLKQKKSSKQQPFYSSTKDLTTINLDKILQ